MDDLISRQAAVGIVEFECGEWRGLASTIVKAIEQLPSAHPELDEWCVDCKEYDQERHCCPRFNRVIREAVKEIQPERKKGKWINGYCSECGEHAPYWAMASTYHVSKFCPNCGAVMEEI